MSQIVLLAGGSPHAHDFAATGAALTELITSHGHEVRLFNDPDLAAEALESGPGALVVDGLWWQMDGEAYDRWRPDQGYSPSAATRSALVEYVRSGGGLLAMHTAVICFDDWSAWGDVLGGAWQWGVSSHPPLGAVEAHIVAEHPVVAGLPPTFELIDEVYGDLSMHDDVDVLAVAPRHDADVDQPVVWTHRFGSGRVVVDTFGHAPDSVGHPDHARLVVQGLNWTLEEA